MKFSFIIVSVRGQKEAEYLHGAVSERLNGIGLVTQLGFPL